MNQVLDFYSKNGYYVIRSFSSKTSVYKKLYCIYHMKVMCLQNTTIRFRHVARILHGGGGGGGGGVRISASGT